MLTQKICPLHKAFLNKLSEKTGTRFLCKIAQKHCVRALYFSIMQLKLCCLAQYCSKFGDDVLLRPVKSVKRSFVTL